MQNSICICSKEKEADGCFDSQKPDGWAPFQECICCLFTFACAKWLMQKLNCMGSVRKCFHFSNKSGSYFQLVWFIFTYITVFKNGETFHLNTFFSTLFCLLDGWLLLTSMLSMFSCRAFALCWGQRSALASAVDWFASGKNCLDFEYSNIISICLTCPGLIYSWLRMK